MSSLVSARSMSSSVSVAGVVAEVAAGAGLEQDLAARVVVDPAAVPAGQLPQAAGCPAPARTVRPRPPGPSRRPPAAAARCRPWRRRRGTASSAGSAPAGPRRSASSTLSSVPAGMPAPARRGRCPAGRRRRGDAGVPAVVLQQLAGPLQVERPAASAPSRCRGRDQVGVRAASAPGRSAGRRSPGRCPATAQSWSRRSAAPAGSRSGRRSCPATVGLLKFRQKYRMQYALCGTSS